MRLLPSLTLHDMDGQPGRREDWCDTSSFFKAAQDDVGIGWIEFDQSGASTDLVRCQ